MAHKPPPLPEENPHPSSPVVNPEVLPPEANISPQAGPDESPLPRWLNRKKLALAFVIAALSDALSIWLQLVLPLQLALDFLTAFLLFIVLGWRWPLLLGLVMEAIPGIAIFPAWVMVVATIAALGQPRPGLR
ncbi:hypothetical protein NXS98_03430 [Fontisphaera persica]|uniref:hypothetical protein n=1 Tax=Fontisphaera persica TaxID=2974023 RepID=UPI0024C0B014|nr:hypothetical protein [Fontisphaera persica]WCJ60192.1 hypothetical protein NXS98_03430 [Fontisphaera persica]